MGREKKQAGRRAGRTSKNTGRSSSRLRPIREGEEQKIRFLTLKEWERIKEQPKNLRDQIIIELLYATGCTVNELVNIKVSDLSFEKHEVRIGAESSRNHEGRKALIPSSLIEKIEDYLREIHPGEEKSRYLLATRQSPQITTKRVRQIVQKYASLAGVKDKNNPQILRYTHIVHAFRKGVPIPAIQRQVGIKRSRAIQIFNQLKTEVTEDAYRAFWE
ncbi:hypothetical protein D6764_04530 [Candidatus Woesearchaeota archaeon]|nr:MAG: hypothetical protein D6764_04530 [Candidatus Woesearchaeota archaeon]